ncbi:hypothetical protein [Streptomyces sp. NPDC001068]|uniref:hypothetical protein n=1 Tax=Streptomyces sp. NPDC001068 TaxID=3364544 RepID=UPI0036878531
MMVERRASDLTPMLWPGAEIEAAPGVVERYDEAPDLAEPIRGIGPEDGPVRTMWCPQCQEEITGSDLDVIAACSPITVQAPSIAWPGYRRLAGLVTVKPCGHAFRVVDGQTLVEIRESAA